MMLLKILPKIKQIGTLMGQYFLKTWYLLGTFIGLLKVCGSTSLLKTKLEYPLGSLDGLFFIFFKFQSFRPQGSNSKFDLGRDLAL